MHPINPYLDQQLGAWRQQKQPGQPLIIGIGGGTGSGKSTIAAEIQRRLAPLSVTIVNQDKFFKPREEMPTYFSEYFRMPCPDFNRPDSIYADRMLAYCQQLSGMDVAILEGILMLYYPEMRQLMDLRCYVSLDLDEMLIRRTKRNLAAGYGGDYEEIAHYNLECVTRQHLRYNAPTERLAQLVIPNGNEEASQREEILTSLCAAIQRQFAPNGGK